MTQRQGFVGGLIVGLSAILVGLAGAALVIAVGLVAHAIWILLAIGWGWL